MGTGINSGTSYVLLTQENATVGVSILRPLGPRHLGPLTLGPWGSTCAKWSLRMGDKVMIWFGYRYYIFTD